MPLFARRAPASLRERTTITVLGMHRSGTSAVTGMLADLGIELGPVSEKNRFNPRGNREIRELNRLHERILERNGGAWWRPPESVQVRSGDRRRRNEILERIEGPVIAVKDPRMLPCIELWRDVDPAPIGVIRNPVVVRRSLEHRARERGERHPQLSSEEWERLWLTYNRALLEEHHRQPFPVVDFERDQQLDEQVRAALRFWGVEPAGESSFFEGTLVSEGADDWRSEVTAAEALSLWDELAALAAA
jgi:hypothetical protein